MHGLAGNASAQTLESQKCLLVLSPRRSILLLSRAGVRKVRDGDFRDFDYETGRETLNCLQWTVLRGRGSRLTNEGF